MKAKDPLELLLQNISEDDAVCATSIVARHPAVVTARVETARYDSAIAHWLYAGDTALHAAAAGHRVAIAKVLLQRGADVNAVGPHRDARPLHYAADGFTAGINWNPRAQVMMIKQLLKAGAALEAADKNGATALHRAVRTRCARAVRCLLAAGANPAARNKPGSTPFHLAVQNTGRGGSGGDLAKEAQAEIILSSLHLGISAELEDSQGRSVLAWARSEKVRELLLG